MPLTLRQWEDSLRQPALCELLPVRDYLDGCIIRTNGCFVAGYEAVGLNTFFHSDETRNRTKETLEALVRTLPERSMRMQVRYEVTEGHGYLTERYVREQRIENPVLQALDRERLRLWKRPPGRRPLLAAQLARVFHLEPSTSTTKGPDFESPRKNAPFGRTDGSFSANKCIQANSFASTRISSQNLKSLYGSRTQATLEATGMQTIAE